MRDVDPYRRALARTTESWNHNTHYHRLIPRAAPPPYGQVLDVGCGEGLLTRRLAPLATQVTGVDLSSTMIERARASVGPRTNLDYVCGDVLTIELGHRFDLVTCFATLHHLDLHAGLDRLRSLTAPGGTLLVVGLARTTSALDVVASLVGVPANLWANRRRGHWEPDAPLAEPTVGLDQIRAACRELLPGARLRRHLYWRYSLTWHAPSND